MEIHSTDPHLSYQAYYQKMMDLRQMRWNFSPALAYCLFRIRYHLLREIKSETSPQSRMVT